MEQEETRAKDMELKARDRKLMSLEKVLEAPEKDLDARHSRYETAQACIAGLEQGTRENKQNPQPKVTGHVPDRCIT